MLKSPTTDSLLGLGPGLSFVGSWDPGLYPTIKILYIYIFFIINGNNSQTVLHFFYLYPATMYMERNPVHELPACPHAHANSESSQPVPMNQLVQNSGIKKSTAKYYLDEFSQQGGNNSGVYRHLKLPECPETQFYLPFPFLSLGCLCLQSAEQIFDDNSRTLRCNTWNGHCHLFGSGCVESQLIEYEQIGNVGYQKIEGSGKECNDENGFYVYKHLYEIVLVMKSGQIVNTRRFEYGTNSIEVLVLVWHKFVFGRRDPAAYVTPQPCTLELPPIN